MRKPIPKVLIAAVIYLGLALCMYLPYFANFTTRQFLIPVNIVIAAAGCFVLSRRWVPSFAASLFAGALYGFGPFMLWICTYHFTVAALAAFVPWFFCPAAYMPKKGYWPIVSRVLSLLPFAAIVGLFLLSSYIHLYPIPITVRATAVTFYGIINPLANSNFTDVPFVFYHVPVIALAMGVLMMFLAGRIGGMLIFAAAVVLSLSKSFLGISPAVWLSIASVCAAVAAGLGADGLTRAGKKDAKWILAIVVLTIALYLEPVLSGQGWFGWPATTVTDQMRLLAIIASAILLIAAWTKLRVPWLKFAVLYSAIATDLFLSAQITLENVM